MSPAVPDKKPKLFAYLTIWYKHSQFWFRFRTRVSMELDADLDSVFLNWSRSRFLGKVLSPDYKSSLTDMD